MKKFTNLFFAAALLLLAGLNTSCNPEIILANKLEGDWTITSYTQDGEEFIGALIASFTIDFKEYDGDEGDVTFTAVSFGTTSVDNGEYTLNADGTEVEFTYSDGTVEEYDIEVDGDELKMDGNIDGFAIEIEAERD